MKQHDNDNEPNPWSAIGLQAALIVNKLRVHAQLTEQKTADDETKTDKDERTGEGSQRKAERAEIAVLKNVLSGRN
jgi:hypothetical protein